VVPLLRRSWWHEVALWFPEQRTLVCADAVGTAEYYRGPGEELGVSPLLRLTPPRRLLAVEPEHVLVGHGEGIHEDATGALREAVTLARRRTPSWAWAGLRTHRRVLRRTR
jgi:glyoxylase-like metal-dependent hydrolase (beta-lactamase superfamily II)